MMKGSVGVVMRGKCRVVDEKAAKWDEGPFGDALLR